MAPRLERRLRPRPGHPYFAGAPLLIAHRGGAGLAPENTLSAFRSAVEDWGADILELDVHLSRDGELVVIHDPTVDRTTDGTGRVAERTLDQLRALDAGHRFRDVTGDYPFRGRGVRIPLFREVLEAFPHTRLNVDSKAPEAAGPLAETVRRHGARDRVLIAGVTEACRAGARGYGGPWGASRPQIARFFCLHRAGLARLHRARPDVLQVPEFWRGMRLVTRRFVRDAHALNLPVHVWTVDDPVTMRRFLEWGVDGIQTDRPDLLADVLREVAWRPPPPARRSPPRGAAGPGRPGRSGP